MDYSNQGKDCELDVILSSQDEARKGKKKGMSFLCNLENEKKNNLKTLCSLLEFGISTANYSGFFLFFHCIACSN